MFDYDLIVIGAGPGGYESAIRSAQYGMKTALIEFKELGGTCLNRGCIPTKSLMHTALAYDKMKKSSEMGISAENISYDIEKIYEHKNETITKLRSGIELLIKANKIDYFQGKASITAKNTVFIDGNEQRQITGKNILAATGSLPAKPPIEGIDLPGVITSNEILDEKGTDFKSLTIIGGGVIGVEFATIFHSLGTKITIIEAADRILPNMDKEISRSLNMILKKRGIDIHTAAKVEKITKNNDSLCCHFTQKEKNLEIESESVLVSVGRKPNIDGLFHASITPKYDRGIVTDENFMTNIPGIYAIGDIIHGSIQLAHTASAQGLNAVSHIAGYTPEINLHTVPSCIYTDPEIASVGITPDKAKEQNIPVKTGKFIMTGNGKSMIENQDRGFIKVTFHEETNVILGAQLMCSRATDIISELTTAIVHKLTLKDLSSVIRPHPTFTEGVTEAVEAAEGMALHIAPKK